MEYGTGVGSDLKLSTLVNLSLGWSPETIPFLPTWHLEIGFHQGLLCQLQLDGTVALT